MKLKLLAPFFSPRFSIRGAAVIERRREYLAAWNQAQHRFRTQHPRGLPTDCAVRFVHAIDPASQARSRYRSIESHSLAHPLHAVEVRVRLSEAQLRLWPEQQSDAGTEQSLGTQIGNALVRSGCTALVRIYDHRVSTLEMDIPLDDLLAVHPQASLMPALDALQQDAITFTEAIVDELYEQVVLPTCSWLLADRDLGPQFLELDMGPDSLTEIAESLAAQSCRTMWVTRTLIVEASDGGEFPATWRERRNTLVAHWLKDVPKAATHTPAEQPGSSKGSTFTDDGYSLRWLNYFFSEGSYTGAYPDHGWHLDGKGTKAFCPEWNAMEIAQYYYAAFEVTHAAVSLILASAVSRGRTQAIGTIQDQLDAAIRDAHLLRMEYDDNAKYYARVVAEELERIMDGWGFARIASGLSDRIDACSERLQNLHSRRADRASLMTDLVLLAIGVTSVFGMVLALAQHGRSLIQDAALIPHETGTLNITQWIAAHSTDAVLSASLVLSLGLVALYVFFAIRR